MGNGWHEWPLVLFTVLGQCVAGALIVSGLGWFALKDDTAARQRLVRSMFFLWLVMGVGFLASIMHLGSPLRAFNSLNRVGASGLSNEIAAGSIFFAVGGFWWLVAVLGKMPETLGKLWLLVSMVLGLVFIWAMTRVYQIDTVPTWYNGYTTLAFFLTAFVSGPLFAALLLRAARVIFNGVTFAAVSVLALLLLAAWLAENEQHALCEQLLAWHLFPWSTRFLEEFVANANHPFYQALGELAQQTLAQWHSQLLIPVAVKTLYR